MDPIPPVEQRTDISIQDGHIDATGAGGMVAVEHAYVDHTDVALPDGTTVHVEHGELIPPKRWRRRDAELYVESGKIEDTPIQQRRLKLPSRITIEGATFDLGISTLGSPEGGDPKASPIPRDQLGQ